MPILSCAATTCVYNKDELCAKGDIKVGGENARIADETCCTSFVERGTSQSNAVNGSDCGCTAIDVKCEACSCVHNEDRKCAADSIDIEGRNACECRETECGTFRCKHC